MPAVKLQKFYGIAPKIAPEQLPDTAAQEASNLKVTSGDLVPYRYPYSAGNSKRSDVVPSIYPMRDPSTGALKWLSWATDVDVAVSSQLDADEQRIYYTGDSAPKVTNYTKAISGSSTYPAASYDLGLPLPTATPSASAASFSTKTVSTYARDSGNIATIVTSAAHGLKTGAVITISGFTTASAWNTTNTVITVTNTTTFTYYNTGASAAAAGTDTGGKVDLAGGSVERTYLYTWITPWDEESIPSDPSAAIYIKEGQVVTVSNLPNSAPAGSNYIRGIRLYRIVTSSTDSAYLRLNSIWFPNTATQASRTSNVVTMKFTYPHNLVVGDYIKTSGTAFGGTPDTSYDVTDVAVASVVDDYTITYAAVGADKATTATTAGTLYWNVAENGASPGTYYTSTTFTDNYDVLGLSLILESEDYDAPDSEMQGLVSAHNNILVGFVGNEVCFSEPDKPWAWPTKYRKVFPDNVVAVAAANGFILVLTDRYPYLVEGSSPSLMQYSRIDVPYPCLSKRGVVTMPWGIIWPTHGGLASYSGNGVQLATVSVDGWDTWTDFIDPTALTAEFFDNKYYASDSAHSILFEPDEQTGGVYTTVSTGFNGAFYDSVGGSFYYTADTVGTVYEWDKSTQPLASMTWKSKKIVTQEYINIGAARVIADYDTVASDQQAIIDYNNSIASHNATLWTAAASLAPLNGGIKYTDPDTLSTVYVSGALNSTILNGDAVTLQAIPYTSTYPLTFSLWVEGELLTTVSLTSSDIFRLPSGYRSDTFEVGVSGTARVKAIHLGETPYGLRTA